MNKLSPQQLLMLGMIIRQRKKVGRDFLEFDYDYAQKRLNEMGDAYRYGIIGRREQEEILHQFKHGDLFKINYVVKIIDHECGIFHLDWNHGDYSWIGENFVELVPDYQTLNDVYGKVFILMTAADVAKIYNDCDDIQKAILFSEDDLEKYTAYLSYEDAHFVVRCDEKTYALKTSHSGNTSRILEHVAKHPDTSFDREQLRTELNIHNLNDSLKEIFKHNKQVNYILKPFFTIDIDEIKMSPKAEITTPALKIIQASVQ